MIVPSYSAQESICAQVKIEILQELTLEREAFEARMTINNGLTGVALDQISVDVTFADKNGNTVRATSDPNDLTAKFFIRLQDGSSIPANIPGATSAKITWLIIPAKGAAGQSPQGELYSVGATLRYRSGGDNQEVQVSPDTITVKPLPDLTLDYFLPSEVYADDPFTEDVVEPPVPFNLGVRVKNNGYGAARNLKIESAQPKIVDNKLGLLVDFRIQGSEVNGQPATASLLANFGDIQPNRSGVARWVMTTTLSGRFVEFTANYTHADELGGELTSLFSTNGVRTHLLVHDVLVDLPGRDGIRDFLALDGTALKVYESENTDSSVTDQSGNSSISGSSNRYTVGTTPSSGFLFIKLPDPSTGAQVLRSASRADGKALNIANAWQSKTQDRNTHQWSYFVNVFDVNNTAGLPYTLQFDASTQTNRPPALDPIPDRSVPVGAYLNFAITASDPDGNALQFAFEGPTLAGATLDANTGAFTWRPTEAQIGTNRFAVAVTDNGQPPLSASGSFAVIVNGVGPVITNQPTDLVLTAGTNAAFSVGATGAEPLAYQWLYNSTNLLAGETNSTLVLTNLLIENAGLYAVSVTNAYGSVLSSNAQLTVNLVAVPLGTVQGKPVNASVAKLLLINRVHARYPLSLTSMSTVSTNGGSITLSNGLFTYTPPASYVGQDTFTYTVTNNHGCSANGKILVTITSTNSQSLNKVVSITSVGNGWVLLFSGIPGRSYVLQSAPAVTGPWADQSGSLTADSTRLIQFTDYTTPPPTMRFYRIRAATP